MVPLERRKYKLFTAIMARLRDRRSSPQAKLVSTLSGRSVSVNVILLSMVSENMSSMMRDVLSNSDGIVKIMVPVEIGVLENLVKFIGKGCAYFHSMAEVVAVGQAAKMLGISIGNWEVKSGVTQEEIKIAMKEYNCQLCQTTFREKRSLTRHEVNVHGATSTAATYSCEACMKTYYRKYGLDVHNLSKKHKKQLLLNSTSALHNSPTYPTKSLKKKVSQILPMKKKVKQNKASKPPVKKEYNCKLCQTTFRNNCSLTYHEVEVHGVTSTAATYSCETCMYVCNRKSSMDNHNLSKRHKRRLLLNSTPVLHNSLTNPTKSLKKKVSHILPMKKKVKLNKASKPPVSGHKKHKLVDGKWVCTICHVAFTWHFKLNAHLDQTHNVKIDKYTCNVCQYTSYSQRNLQLHKKSKKHLQRCAEWTVGKEQDGQGEQEQDGQGEQEQDGQEEQDLVIYNCDPCQTTFLTLKKYNHHLKSKKHKTQQKEEKYQAKPDNNNKG